jgi:hypothetical protein
MKHDILLQGESTVTCSCGCVIAGSSLEDAKRRHEVHFGLAAAREALGEDDNAADS